MQWWEDLYIAWLFQGLKTEFFEGVEPFIFLFFFKVTGYFELEIPRCLPFLLCTDLCRPKLSRVRGWWTEAFLLSLSHPSDCHILLSGCLTRLLLSRLYPGTPFIGGESISFIVFSVSLSLSRALFCSVVADGAATPWLKRKPVKPRNKLRMDSSTAMDK